MPAQRPAAAVGSTEELLERAAAGDLHAFARIVRLRHEAVTRVALAVTNDAAVASDAATMAFVRAWLSMRGAPWAAMRRPHDASALDRFLYLAAATEAARLLDFRATLQTYASDTLSQAPATADPSPMSGLDAHDCALLVLNVMVGMSAEDLAKATHRRRAGMAAQLERLVVAASRDLPPTVGPAQARRLLEAQLRARAAGPVARVDADRVARRAVAEQADERGQQVSVAIGAVAGLVLTTYPYWIHLLYRH